MSPRRHRREPAREPDAPFGGGPVLRETWRGLDYEVRMVAGGRAVKTYRCPGCDHEVRPGTPHVVAWPAEGGGASDRRHWHRPCWAARDRRR